MSIIADLRNEGVLKGYWDFRQRHALDESGNSNNGTFYGTPRFSRDGLTAAQNSGVTVSDDASLRLTEMTLVAYASQPLQAKGVAQHFISKRDAGTIEYQIRINASNNFDFFNGTLYEPTSSLAVSGKKYLAFACKSGEVADFYADGSLHGSSASTITLTADTQDLSLSNYSTSSAVVQPVSAYLIISRKLTATEHAELYAELDSMIHTSKVFSNIKNTLKPISLDNNRFTEYTGSSVPNYDFDGWTESPQTANLYFEPVGDNGVKLYTTGDFATIVQNVCKVGRDYKTKFNVLDVTAGHIRVNNDADGNQFSSTGAKELDFTSNSTSFGFKRGSGSTNVSFSDIELYEYCNIFKFDWGINTSVANVTAGNILENTHFEILSTYCQIKTDGNRKYIEDTFTSTTDALLDLTRFFPASDTMIGRWDFEVMKASGGSANYYLMLTNTKSGDITTTNNYNITIPANGAIVLRRGTTALGGGYLPVGTVSVGEWHRITWTIETGGVMKVYLDGTLIISDTDNTFTELPYFVWRGQDLGDKLCLATKDGSSGFSKELC